MSKELEFLKRKVSREILARKEAERILENKALELYHTNEELRKMNLNLEETILKRTEALEKAKSVAEKAQKAEQQFLANMSHEIRTPLNAVIGMSHLLYDTNPTAEQIEYLDNLKSSAKLLHSLISDILDFTKIESGNIEIQSKPFNLVDTIRDIQKTFELKLDGQPIEIKSNIDERIENLVIGDELLFHQIFFNLLGNAEKFTKVGSILIDVKMLTKLNDNISIQFKIKDTGIGIESDKLKHIFENFKQAANKQHLTNRSTGLGLSITRQLIELQGGSIEVESELGKGSCFSFVLSYIYSDVKNKDNKKAPMLDSKVRFPDLKLLIAEDNSMNRKYIRRVFQKWDISFEMAVNGAEAVEMAKAEKYDLIFMDLQMPIMGGVEATSEIRNHPNLNQHTVIVALTASALSEHRNQALNAGMNDFVTKPFTPEQLLKVLSKYFLEQSNNPNIMNSENNSAPSDNPEGQPSKSSDEPIIQIHSYHPKLDKAYLDTIYGRDWEYAADMFLTFLEDIAPNFDRLMPLVEAANWEAYYQVAHKVKPSLQMVGLPALKEKVLTVEVMAKTAPDQVKLRALTVEILMDLEAYFPILKAQLEFLQSKMVEL